MNGNKALDISDVKDESGKIRPHFPRTNGMDSVPDGKYDGNREDGSLLLQISYRLGTVHGPYLEFWSNGQTACEGQFQNGMQEGTWTFFRDDGSLMERISFRDGIES